MKNLKIVLAGLLLVFAISFVSCKSNFETPDVQEETVENDTGRFGYSGTGGVIS